MPLGLHILDLPVDVLALILAPLLTSPLGRVPLCVCAGGRGRGRGDDSAGLADALPVLLAHPALYAVACPLLYGGANRFVLDLTGDHGGHVRSHLREEGEKRRRRLGRDWEAHADGSDGDTGGEGWKDGGGRGVGVGDGDGGKSGDGFLLLQQEARRRVRRMEVRLDRLRGWVDEGITPLVEDMLMRGALAELDVTLDLAAWRGDLRAPGPGPGRVRVRAGAYGDASRMDLDVFARPPVRGLLRLLADPDLRRGRLRISWAHGDAWCAFHGGGCARGGGEGKPNGLGEGEGDGDEGLVEVDWRAIVRELDPEGKARAVAPR